MDHNKVFMFFFKFLEYFRNDQFNTIINPLNLLIINVIFNIAQLQKYMLVRSFIGRKNKVQKKKKNMEHFNVFLFIFLFSKLYINV